MQWSLMLNIFLILKHVKRWLHIKLEVIITAIRYHILY